MKKNTSYFTPDLINLLSKPNKPELSKEKYLQLLVEIDFLQDMMRHFVGTLYKDFYNLKRIRVAWMLLPSAEFGAFCYTSREGVDPEKFDFIGVNMGTVSILYDNFTHILSSPHSFADYGNVSVEKMEEHFWLQRVSERDTPYCPPNCPVRAEYAKILTAMAVRFLMFHEATHLYNGHVDWISNNSLGMRTNLETGSTKIIGPPLLSHYFEFIADDCALQFIATHALDTMRTCGRNIANMSAVEQAGHHLAFGSILHTVRTVVYAIYVLFRSTDPGPWNKEFSITGSHPRELIRARFMFTRLSDILVSTGLAVAGDVMLDFMILTVFEAEQDLARMVGREVDRKSFMDLLTSSQVAAHMENVHDFHAEMVPLLKPFFRGTHFPNQDQW